MKFVFALLADFWLIVALSSISDTIQIIAGVMSIGASLVVFNEWCWKKYRQWKERTKIKKPD